MVCLSVKQTQARALTPSMFAYDSSEMFCRLKSLAVTGIDCAQNVNVGIHLKTDPNMGFSHRIS